VTRPPAKPSALRPSSEGHGLGGTTVYLAGFELRKQGANTTATRYYGGVAVRTTAGLAWRAADHHGTGTLTIDAATLATTRRRLDPYGNPRTTTSIAWPANRGFVGGIIDNTGLTHLGAREYDPDIGRFISRDPVFNKDNPQELGGYSYAGNNPATIADPTGLCGICNLVAKTSRVTAKQVLQPLRSNGRSAPTKATGCGTCAVVSKASPSATKSIAVALHRDVPKTEERSPTPQSPPDDPYADPCEQYPNSERV
jgi:RHS repeat-associated protein